jgi:carboxyl-terminal processing protease
MLLAPPLKPAGKKQAWLWRFATACGLLSAALALVVINLILVLTHYYLVIPEVTPQELYHRAWQMTRDNIYDTSLLADWDKWEHKYDSQIHTEEDAVKFINIMIASLHEPVTGFMDARSVQQAVMHAGDHLEGVGLSFDTQIEAAGNPVTDAHGRALPVLSQDRLPMIKQPLRGSPAYKAGIKTGDVIVSVDGKPATGWTLDELTQALHGKVGTAVKLDVRRNGKVSTITLKRDVVNIPIVSIKRLPGKIGYIRLETFDRWDTAQQLRDALEELADCEAYVIDLRDNTGGFIHSACDAASMFLDKGLITTIEMRIPEGAYVKYSVAVEPNASVFGLDNGPFAGIRAKLPRRIPNLTGSKPVVILVSDWTASASELFTGALKDNGRVTVVGVKTFGKGIGQMFVPVGNGCRLRLTNQKLWSPNGDFRGDCGKTVSNGVEPDVVVKPAPGLIFGDEDSDNQLAVAVEILSKKLGGKP